MKQRLTTLFADERVRFLFVGGINTVVGYGLFVAIELSIGRWIGYLGSLYLSYLLGVTSAFFLHRRLTFRAHRADGSQWLAFLRFASVYVVSLAINTIGLPLLVELGHLPPLGAQAIMVVVTTLISYVGHKYFSFRRPGSSDQAPVDATNNVPEPDTASDGSSAM